MNKWKRPQGKTAEWQFAKTVNKKEEDMKTIIAEKPSVAREIARIVGATKREEGYFEGGGYAVTWRAFLH